MFQGAPNPPAVAEVGICPSSSCSCWASKSSALIGDAAKYFYYLPFHLKSALITLSLEADLLAEHSIPIFVLAEHHELVLLSRDQVLYRGLHNVLVHHPNRSPLWSFDQPVPYSVLQVGAKVS